MGERVRRIWRELFLLTRGDLRGAALLGGILLVSLAFRIVFPFRGGREDPGMEHLMEGAAALKEVLAESGSAQDSGIDINRADSSDLIPLPGIGPVFAGRIVRYRELLGGYVSPGQLREVYGLPEETIRLISDKLEFDSTAIRRIRLNRATFRELLRHPYLEYEDVRNLVNFREFSGGVTSIGQLRSQGILVDSTLESMAPYLRFDH